MKKTLTLIIREELPGGTVQEVQKQISFDEIYNVKEEIRDEWIGGEVFRLDCIFKKMKG